MRFQFRTVSNRCKYVLKNAKDQYANMIKLRIEAESLGSREFWKITSRVLNHGESNIPTIINGPEILSSASDKATLFAKILLPIQALIQIKNCLTSLLAQTFNCLTFFITAEEVAKLFSNLDTSKAVGSDEIPVIVRKNLIPELASILSKLFNHCIKKGCLPQYWRKSSVLYSKTMVNAMTLLNIVLSIYFLSSARSLNPSSIITYLTIWKNIVSFLIISMAFDHRDLQPILLTVITDRISRALDCSLEARAIALDISKTFDWVWHIGLLHKLQSYGTMVVFSPLCAPLFPVAKWKCYLKVNHLIFLPWILAYHKGLS